MSEQKDEVPKKAGRMGTAPCGCRRLEFDDGSPSQWNPCLAHSLERAGQMLLAASGQALLLQERLANLHVHVGVDPATGLATPNVLGIDRFRNDKRPQ